eukprot:SAG11_NODE_28622_length_319_cov_1.595455_1_plen_21_part_10
MIMRIGTGKFHPETVFFLFLF